MKKITLLLTALFAASVLHSCKPEEETRANPPDLRPLSAPAQTVSKANVDFSFRMLKTVVGESDTNVFISPLSIGIALGMTLNGADGETLNGILQTINFDGMSAAQVNEGYKELTTRLIGMDNTTRLSLANGIWYDKRFAINPPFSENISTYYDGKVDIITTKEAVNDWIENKTDHHIKNMVTSVDNIVMFLVNAIYFKGEWASKFDKANTKTGDFTTHVGSNVATNFMHAKEIPIGFSINDEATVVDLPYGNGQFSMTILMPGEKSLSEFTAGLSETKLNDWISATEVRSADITMPKFKMDWKGKLNKPLSSMGMATAFSNDASFPYLFKDLKSDLSISYVLHQSFIEVDEEGSVATAATVVAVTYTSLPQPVSVVINRPFLFLIREKHTGAILFIGQYATPPTP